MGLLLQSNASNRVLYQLWSTDSDDRHDLWSTDSLLPAIDTDILLSVGIVMMLLLVWLLPKFDLVEMTVASNAN